MIDGIWQDSLVQVLVAQNSGNSGMVGLPATPTTPGTPQQSGGEGTPLITVPGQPAPAAGGQSQLFLFMGIPVLFLLMMIMSSRKDKKKREEVMSSIKKHDRVLTTGGIIGTVAEITDQEIVLRVEDGRIRFHRSAVASVINPGAAPATGKADAVAEIKNDKTETARV